MSLKERLAMHFNVEYAQLFKRHDTLREQFEEMEEQLTADINELQRENEYLQSELAYTRVQLDRKKKLENRTAEDMYRAAVTDRDERIKDLQTKLERSVKDCAELRTKLYAYENGDAE